MGYPDDTNQLVDYQQYGIQNNFQIMPGVCILPLAEDPPTDPDELAEYSPVIVARLHAPYRIRKYIARGDKFNNPPPVPVFGDTGAFIFINGIISIGNTLNTSYSNFDWQTGVEYLYVENCVIRPEDGLVLGTPPFSQLTSQINAQNYQGSAPSIGAVAFAGPDVVIGYLQGQVIVNQNSQSNNGSLNDTWGYNTNSFYPGTLFYTDLPNGGTAT